MTGEIQARQWVRLAPESALARGRSVCVEVDGDLVAVFHTASGYYGLADACLHMGGPLSEGELEPAAVTCPWHGWRYSLSSGERVDRRGQTTMAYPVEVRDGWLWLGPPIGTPTQARNQRGAAASADRR